MKNYKEIADSVFERKEKYETEKIQRRKRLTCALTPICCVCLVALLGFGVWQGGLFSKAPIQSAEDAIITGTKDWYEPSESEPNYSVDQAQAEDGKQHDDSSVSNNAKQDEELEGSQAYNPFDDRLGTIVYNGRTYVQAGAIEYKEDMLDKKIGNGEDFEGYYKDLAGTEIFTVKDRPDLLVAKLANGANIVLKYYEAN